MNDKAQACGSVSSPELGVTRERCHADRDGDSDDSWLDDDAQPMRGCGVLPDGGWECVCGECGT